MPFTGSSCSILYHQMQSIIHRNTRTILFRIIWRKYRFCLTCIQPCRFPLEGLRSSLSVGVNLTLVYKRFCYKWQRTSLSGIIRCRDIDDQKNHPLIDLGMILIRVFSLSQTWLHLSSRTDLYIGTNFCFPPLPTGILKFATSQYEAKHFRRHWRK